MLVAEELAASGCSLVISVTSAGVISPLGDTPYFILIERALRDEGTSVHYLPPAEWSRLAAPLRAALDGAFEELDEPVHPGASWTTDAPFRETETAIAAARSAGAHAVEMEAAGDDFEKGEADGTYRILDVVRAIAKRLRP